MVGDIQYLTFTCPDLAFSVHQLCQFISNPITVHLEVAKRVLRYIRGTLSHGISFTPGPSTLTAFSDADWTGDPFDGRSTTSLLVFLGPSPIYWSSKKQTTIAHSSTEAEYRVLATTAAEVSWLRILFKELRIFLSHIPVLWCDNALAIALSANPVFHSRMKHIEVDYHYVRKRCCVVIYVCILSQARTTSLICSPSPCILPLFFFNVTNSCWIPPLVV